MTHEAMDKKLEDAAHGAEMLEAKRRAEEIRIIVEMKIRAEEEERLRNEEEHARLEELEQMMLEKEAARLEAEREFEAIMHLEEERLEGIRLKTLRREEVEELARLEAIRQFEEEKEHSEQKMNSWG